jgi:vitamin B12 transporter
MSPSRFHSRFRSTRRSPASSLAALLLVAGASPALGQQVLPETVVTADRTAVPAAEVNASVTVITGEQIERRQFRTLADVLRDVPGVAVNRSGGPGKTTSVFMRGANSNHTVVIIDGIRQGDPANATGATDFAHMLAADIERVEVVRGPMSTLYGSDAIGGVINVITRKGAGPLKVGGYLEGGSYRTLIGAASMQGALDRFNYNLSLAGISSGGDTVVPQRFRAPGSKEADPYYNLSWKSRIGYDVSDALQLTWFSRFIGARSQYDAFDVFTSLPSEDPNAYERTRQFYNRLQADIDPFGGSWKSVVGVSYADLKRRDRDEPDALNPFPFVLDGHNHGRRFQFDWKNDIRITPNLSAVAGIDAEHAWFTSNTDGSKGKGNATTIAGYVNGRWTLWDNLFITVGGRLEHHNEFGLQPTGRVGLAYLIRETDTKLKASAGTAFRAPALFELYGSAAFCAGNPNLDPEKSKGFEFGAEQALFGGKLNAGVTFFYNKIRNLITCPPPFSNSENVQRARTQGMETTLSWDPYANLALRGGYTYTDTRNFDTGQRLLRRPKHTFFASADWQPIDGWTLGAEWANNSGRRDFNVSTFAYFRPESYSVFRLTTSVRITDTVSAFGRIENVLDKHYEEADGFKAPFIGAYAGIRIRY